MQKKVCYTIKEKDAKEATVYIGKSNRQGEETAVEFVLQEHVEPVTKEPVSVKENSAAEVSFAVTENGVVKQETRKLKIMLCNNPVIPGQAIDPSIFTD